MGFIYLDIVGSDDAEALLVISTDGLNPFLPTEHRGTIGTFERIPEYIIADFPMVAKLSPRTIGRSPRVDSPLKSTQNFGL